MGEEIGREYDRNDQGNISTRNRVQPFAASPILSMEEHQRVSDDGKQKIIASSFSISERLGLDEFFSLDVWRASVGEVMGTAVLVFMLDTIVVSTVESHAELTNLILSTLAAMIVAILLIAVHPVSGGHLNPLISVSAALVGIISLSRATIYTLAQCLGAVLGALAFKAVVSSSTERASSLGGCTVTTVAAEGAVTVGLGTGQAFWMETFCCFVFLFASIWMAYDHRQGRALGHAIVLSIVGVVVGLLVYVSTLVTAQKGYSGAGLNPARCFGPAVVRGGHLWSEHWVFWAGPGLACVAFFLYTKIIPRQHFVADHAYKHDFFTIVSQILHESRSTKNVIITRAASAV